jgi:dTDP-4-amino-4,6-dideoxygalactose transaminase
LSPPRLLELRQFRQLASTLHYGRVCREGRSLLSRVGGRLRIPPYAPPRLPIGIGPLRAAAGLWQLERYEEIRNHRNRNARILVESLGRIAWHVGESVKPAYLKLRVAVSPADATFAATQCRRHGITVANSNWAKLIEPSGLENGRVNAHRAATFGLDVPVHQNLSRSDVENIAAVFRSAKTPDL